MSIIIGGFVETNYVGIDLWNDVLTSTIHTDCPTNIYPDYVGISGIQYSSTFSEIYIGHYDSVQIFNSTTGAYKETIQLYSYGMYNYVRTIVANGDYLYVLIDDYDGYCRLKKVQLSDRTVLQTVTMNHLGIAYGMDFVNDKIYIPIQYSGTYLIEEYNLSDLSYVNSYSNTTYQFYELNNSCFSESTGYIYYPGNGWYLIRFDTNAKTFSNTVTTYNVVEFRMDDNGYIWGYSENAPSPGLQKYDSSLNLITSGYTTLNYFGGMFIDSNYIYMIQRLNVNSKTAVYKVNLTTLSSEQSVESSPSGGYCGLKISADLPISSILFLDEEPIILI